VQEPQDELLQGASAYLDCVVHLRRREGVM
jgi:hypothetical protein